MKKQAAVFTVVKDEKYFLPRWLKHYQKYFDNKDIFVLDHQTKDGSTKNLPVKTILIENEQAYDHNWLTAKVCFFQKELLNEYECVLFSEADEFVYTVEQPLNDFINDIFLKDSDINYLTTVTYELIQNLDNELPLKETDIILEKRKYWCPYFTFGNKTLLSKIPLKWLNGFHKVEHLEPCFKHPFFMLHLHKWDFELMCERTFRSSSWCMNDGYEGWQNKLKTREELFNFFINFRGGNLSLMDEFHKITLSGL